MHIRDTHRRRQPHHAVRTVHHWSPVVGGCGRAVVRNWVAKAALARWRLRLAQRPARGAACSADGRQDAGGRLHQAWMGLKRASGPVG